MASLNLNSGPPLSAVNAWPSSSNATVITVPASLPWTSCPASVPGNVEDLRILEDGDIEPGGLFGLVVEPQTWADPLNNFHGILLACRGRPKAKHRPPRDAARSA